tara:strand:- start:875 stop:1783 length:909 start_codon:yes stop_codon:yes gene_type:complete
MPQECLPGRERAQDALEDQLQKIAINLEGVRQCDLESIHDMRVASRRLRTLLKIYKPYLDKAARKTLNQGARTIGRALGRRRELDVMVAMLNDHRDEAHGLWLRFMDHMITVLVGRQERESRSCLEAVTCYESEAMQQAREAMVTSLNTNDACIVPLSADTLLDGLYEVQFARKVWKKEGGAEELHEVRIALKRFRYRCEFHKEIYGEPMEIYILRLKEAQSMLGEWNECRLLEEMVLILGNAADYDLAQGAPLVAEAYGERAAVLEDNVAVLLSALFCRAGRQAFEMLVDNAVLECDCEVA